MSGNGIFDFNILELLTFIGVLVGLGLAGWQLFRGRWGKFEFRFLHPTGRIDPKTEKRASVVRLLPGRNVVRISLRPRTGISVINRLAFSCFGNRNYPMRLIPGSTGDRISPTAIGAVRIRRHIDADEWENWETLSRTETGSGRNIQTPCVRGSRQVFEIEYEAALTSWDGVLGVAVQYENGGNYEQAYVNSKAFVVELNQTPVTFKFRRVHSTKLATTHDAER